jgi:hypothetical protein
MCKIIKLIELHFGNNTQFTANEFSIKTKIDSKVSAMNLKRLANSLRIGYSAYNNFYWDWGISQANIEVEKWNTICDKYESVKYLKKHTK